ncbi:sialoadhesin-like [Sardina pilchardus]|uniref:sialoadhesin-like n=1 Tax=Sardina pilchardus TaxID=27697 RepID=UPI002E0D44C6
MYTCMLVVLFLLSLPAVQGGGTVTYSTNRVCGLKGAAVVLPCTYEYSWIGGYRRGEWYEEKSGTVIVHNPPNYDCSLRIDKLSNYHFGVYQFRCKGYLHSSWITGRSGVELSITDLQVKEEAVVGNQNQIKVTCSTSCSLDSKYKYIWYKNEQTLKDKTTVSIVLDSTRPSEKGNYSCAVRGHEAHSSPAVCAPRKQCWSVTYSTDRVCGLKRASVTLPCTYYYSGIGGYRSGEWYEEKSGRVIGYYLTNYNCSLKIDKLSDDHSGVYQFRFYTTLHRSWITGRPGVVLSITDLQVKEEAVVGNQNQIKVTCSTSCSLGSQYVWYKNGQTLRGKTTVSIVLDSTRPSEKGNYSCAVRGHEAHSSPAVCAPRKQCWSVSYSSTRVCGVKGASVVLPCRYEYPWKDAYQRGEWYEEQRGRVREHSNSKYPDCSLNIDNLSDNLTGVYQFHFNTTLHSSWITGNSAAILSVTDLQVMEEAVVGNQNLIKVTCITSCSLGSQYVWYKNGQTLRSKTTVSILLDSTRPSEEGSYSCAVKGHEGHRSDAVCAPAQQCWGVTYSSNSICVLEGSSVDISCTYKYPRDQDITTTFWFNNRNTSHHLEDIRLDKDYQNHTEYLRNERNSCTLRLKGIRESHSGEYGFRCSTEQGESYSGLPGVNITVTALQVFIPPEAVMEGERVTLTCNTTCTLTNTTFIWYQNGQPVIYKHTIRDNKLHLNPVSSEDAGNYSCAVRGHQSLSSTAVFLNVRYPEPVTMMLLASLTIFISLFLLLILGIMCLRRTGHFHGCVIKNHRSRNHGPHAGVSQTVHSDTHDDTYTALNPRTMSSEYDTLQNVRTVSDTYESLQRRAQDSGVYENLQRRETPPTEMELEDLSKK